MLIKILDSEDGQFYFDIVGNNHSEIIATSETYTTKDKCMQTARLFNMNTFEIGDFTTRKKPVQTAAKNPVKEIKKVI
jgi:uncharacterized protein YegP (UPF0339 family)